MARYALGLIETKGLVGAIEAADVAAKAAEVELVGFERVGGGLVTLSMRGDVAAVQAAVQAAAQAVERVGQLLSHHVIAAPHLDLVDLLEGEASEAAVEAAETLDPPALEDLETLSVAQLRRFARQESQLPIKGRQISRANKDELIAALKKAWKNKN